VAVSEQNSEKDTEEAEDEEEAVESEKKGPDNEYKRLIAIPLTRRKHNMDEDLKVDPGKVSRLSLGEKAFEKATISHGADIIR
jgi:phosphatidylinositol phospholipase C, delta